MIFYKLVEVLIGQVINYIFLICPGNLRSLWLRCLWATRQTDKAEKQLVDAERNFSKSDCKELPLCKWSQRSDTVTLLSSFHNCSHSDRTEGERKKNSTSISQGQIKNGRGQNEQITRLLSYYIIKIRCVFLLLFQPSQQETPFLKALTLSSSQESLQMKEKSSVQKQPI